MSIVPFLKTHEAGGVLRRIMPPQGEAAIRGVWLAPMAQMAIDDETSELNRARSGGAFVVFLEKWVSGGFLRVRMSGVQPTDLALLHPPEDDCWELCIRPPKNQFRAFCRFVDIDMLVVTHLASRDILGRMGTTEWAQEMDTCAKEWNKLFPEVAPHRGSNANDYVSENYEEIFPKSPRSG